MDPEKADKLIAGAITSLPYYSAPAGFRLRVLAAIAAVRAAPSWEERALEGAALAVSAWSAAVGAAAVWLIRSYLPDIAAFLIQPGGFARAFGVMAAYGALGLTKLAASLRFASLLASAVSGVPAWYEIAAAALLCSAAVSALPADPASACNR